MREKLQKLMSAEHLTPSRFAELLGIQPSGVSHLLSGRNKPSFDLVQKILRRFPHINPDWLLLEDEHMYRSEQSNIFDSATHSNSDDLTNTAINEEKKIPTQNIAFSESSPVTANRIDEVLIKSSSNQKIVKRVIVLFNDHTFESFEMAK